MNIGGIQRTSTIDFPGCLSCVLFTRGCNLDCFYCHNRALLQSGGPLLAQEELMTFLRRRAGLLDGVVISGGEPTLQPDLLPFIEAIRKLGYRIKLDTNGSRPDVLRSLLKKKLIDYVAVDVKALPEDYAHIAGCAETFDLALQSLSLAAAAAIPHEARTTACPGIREETLLALAGLLPRTLTCWRLNVYRVPAEYRPEDALRVRLPALTELELTALLPSLRTKQPHVIV